MAKESLVAGLFQPLITILTELADGPAPANCFVLNPGDAGLLASLDKLSAAQASAAPPGGSSIAAHVEHVRYGLELMNRWNRGEEPFTGADWSASWRLGVVTESEWASRRADFRAEIHQWREALIHPSRTLDELALNGMVGSVVHLAYHVGAMRQIDRSIRGPAAQD